MIQENQINKFLLPVQNFLKRDFIVIIIFFVLVLFGAIIGVGPIIDIIQQKYDVSFGEGLEIDPFAGVTAVLMGSFSIVVVLFQTRILKRQIEIAEKQNDITRNQLAIESKCELKIEATNNTISCKNSGNSPIKNLIIYQLKNNTANFGEIKKIEYLPVLAELYDRLTIEITSTLIFLYQDGYSNKVHIVIRHYVYGDDYRTLVQIPIGGSYGKKWKSTPLDLENEIEIYEMINKTTSVDEIKAYITNLSLG